MNPNLESRFSVTISTDLIICRRPDGQIESVAWDDLQAVFLETTDEGPFDMDVYWVLVGNRSGCVIPQGANGEAELLDHLQKLAGFDNQAVIEAMLTTDNQRFLCWRKNP